MLELKPCPFCGDRLKEIRADYSFNAPKNLCQLDYICECGMRFTKTVHTDIEDNLVPFRVWNKRTPQKEGDE